jgi:hypothetical protein
VDRPFWDPHRAGFSTLWDKELNHRAPLAHSGGEGIIGNHLSRHAATSGRGRETVRVTNTVTELEMTSPR